MRTLVITLLVVSILTAYAEKPVTLEQSEAVKQIRDRDRSIKQRFVESEEIYSSMKDKPAESAFEDSTVWQDGVPTEGKASIKLGRGYNWIPDLLQYCGSGMAQALLSSTIGLATYAINAVEILAIVVSVVVAIAVCWRLIKNRPMWLSSVGKIVMIWLWTTVQELWKDVSRSVAKALATTQNVANKVSIPIPEEAPSTSATRTGGLERSAVQDVPVIESSPAQAIVVTGTAEPSAGKEKSVAQKDAKENTNALQTAANTSSRQVVETRSAGTKDTQCAENDGKVAPAKVDASTPSHEAANHNKETSTTIGNNTDDKSKSENNQRKEADSKPRFRFVNEIRCRPCQWLGADLITYTTTPDLNKAWAKLEKRAGV